LKPYNVVIGQSGGPTPVINASLRGAVEKAARSERIGDIFGTPNGLEGLLSGKLISLHDKLPSLERASEQPGAVLGTSRHPLIEEEYETILRRLEQVDARVFCYIGGNGSSRTVLALHRYAQSVGKDIRFVHIPKTIDNDLEGTDHSPGYGSAAKFLSHTIQLIAADMISLRVKPRVEIIEVMGGNRGWLPAASALFKARYGFPDLVYMPDRTLDAHIFLSDVERAFSNDRSVMVVIPDHLHIEGLPRDAATIDDPVRRHNAGVGYRTANFLSAQGGFTTRMTVPNALFRIAAGLRSRQDAEEAYRLGEAAIDFALAGYSGGMVSLSRHTDVPYRCTVDWVDLEGVAGEEKPFPSSYWNAEQHRPTQSFLDYVMPLIDNEAPDLLFRLD